MNNNNQNGNRFINNAPNVNSTNLDFNNDNVPNMNETSQNFNNVSTPNQPTTPSQGTSPINEMNIGGDDVKQQIVETPQNEFVNNNGYNETSLNDLNVDGGYNKLEASPYSSEEVVRENIASHEKKTVKITVTQEMKIVIIISIVILVFIIIMPFIFDIVENIRFN